MTTTTTTTHHTTNAAALLLYHGITGNDLNDICHAIAHTYIRKTDSTLGDRTNDLAQYLALTACTRIHTYNPERATIRTWLWTQLQPTCYQWMRRKAEGFGDRRYHQHNRIMLTDTPHNQNPDNDPDDFDIDLDRILSNTQLQNWQHAANKAGIPIEQWITTTLDHAANHPLAA